MKQFCLRSVCHVFALLSLPLATRAAAEPSADEIMARVVSRFEQIQSDSTLPEYIFRKVSVTEEIDVKGKLKERKEKSYDMAFSAGEFFQRRISSRDAAKDPAPLDEAGFKPAKRSDHLHFLGPELLVRYRFEVAGRDTINGRAAYRIRFHPAKHNLPARQPIDRVLGQVGGTLWIDEQEFEVAKAQLHLLGEVALWGGLAGVVRSSAFLLERIRVEEGVWFDSLTMGFFEGRKLFQSGQIRTKSESSQFRRVMPERASL